MTRILLLFSVGLTVINAVSQAAPLTKAQLLELLEKEIDASLILGLIESDCVDFEVDANALLELAEVVPKEILRAAMECREQFSSLENHASPPGTNADVSEISLSEEPALELRDIETVAVVPFLLDGQADAALTAAFQEQLRTQAPKYNVKDALELQVHFEDTGAFHSRTPLKSLLAAGRAVGAQALFLGEGSRYLVLGYPAIRVDVKLVEVNRGELVWSGGGASKGGAWSEQQARKKAAKAALKKIP